MKNHQQGIALVVTLVFLTILTVIGTAAANKGMIELQMAGNVEEMNSSYQSAMSGIAITQDLIGDPVRDPFALGPAKIPNLRTWVETTQSAKLDELNNINHVTINVERTMDDTVCPRQAEGSSYDKISCQQFTSSSDHGYTPQQAEFRAFGAQTRMEMGVMREIIALKSGSLLLNGNQVAVGN